MKQAPARRGSDDGRAAFILVHSPIVGPSTWTPVAAELRRRGFTVVVPDLGPNEDVTTPFWERHVRAVVAALRNLPAERRLILVGHSGAGALLPAIGQAARRPVAAYVFVDAGIPKDGESRLDNGPFAAYLQELYAGGGRYPNWSDEDLRDLVPDAEWRRQVLAELRPPPLAFWEEPIPVVAGWPDAPCAYLRFVPNPAYDAAVAEAQSRGWAYAELTGGHFHPLVDPVAVADEVLSLVARTASTWSPRRPEGR